MKDVEQFDDAWYLILYTLVGNENNGILKEQKIGVKATMNDNAKDGY